MQQQVGAFESATKNSFTNVEQAIKGVGSTFKTAVGTAAGINLSSLISGAVDQFKELVTDGIQYNATLEQGKLSIAALLQGTTQLKGADGERLSTTAAWNINLREASQLQTQIAALSATTLGTQEQLMNTFRVALSFSRGQKASTQELLQFSQGVLNVATLMGLTTVQQEEETRQMLLLEAQRGQVILPVLGLSLQQAQTLRDQGLLIQEINKRLAVYHELAQASATTWTGLVTSASTFANLLSANAFEETFSGVKAVIQGFTEESIRLRQNANFTAELEASEAALKRLGASGADVFARLTHGAAAAANGVLALVSASESGQSSEFVRLFNTIADLATVAGKALIYLTERFYDLYKVIADVAAIPLAPLFAIPAGAIAGLGTFAKSLASGKGALQAQKDALQSFNDTVVQVGGQTGKAIDDLKNRFKDLTTTASTFHVNLVGATFTQIGTPEQAIGNLTTQTRQQILFPNVPFTREGAPGRNKDEEDAFRRQQEAIKSTKEEIAILSAKNSTLRDVIATDLSLEQAQIRINASETFAKTNSAALSIQKAQEVAQNKALTEALQEQAKARESLAESNDLLPQQLAVLQGGVDKNLPFAKIQQQLKALTDDEHWKKLHDLFADLGLDTSLVDQLREMNRAIRDNANTLEDATKRTQAFIQSRQSLRDQLEQQQARRGALQGGIAQRQRFEDTQRASANAAAQVQRRQQDVEAQLQPPEIAENQAALIDQQKVADATEILTKRGQTLDQLSRSIRDETEQEDARTQALLRGQAVRKQFDDIQKDATNAVAQVQQRQQAVEGRVQPPEIAALQTALTNKQAAVDRNADLEKQIQSFDQLSRSLQNDTEQEQARTQALAAGTAAGERYEETQRRIADAVAQVQQRQQGVQDKQEPAQIAELQASLANKQALANRNADLERAAQSFDQLTRSQTDELEQENVRNAVLVRGAALGRSYEQTQRDIADALSLVQIRQQGVNDKMNAGQIAAAQRLQQELNQKKEENDLLAAQQQLATKISDDIVTSFMDMAKGVKSAFETLRDVVQSILGDITQELLRRQIVKPLADIIDKALDAIFKVGKPKSQPSIVADLVEVNAAVVSGPGAPAIPGATPFGTVAPLFGATNTGTLPGIVGGGFLNAAAQQALGSGAINANTVNWRLLGATLSTATNTLSSAVSSVAGGLLAPPPVTFDANTVNWKAVLGEPVGEALAPVVPSVASAATTPLTTLATGPVATAANFLPSLSGQLTDQLTTLLPAILGEGAAGRALTVTAPIVIVNGQRVLGAGPSGVPTAISTLPIGSGAGTFGAIPGLPLTPPTPFNANTVNWKIFGQTPPLTTAPSLSTLPTAGVATAAPQDSFLSDIADGLGSLTSTLSKSLSSLTSGFTSLLSKFATSLTSALGNLTSTLANSLSALVTSSGTGNILSSLFSTVARGAGSLFGGGAGSIPGLSLAPPTSFDANSVVWSSAESGGSLTSSLTGGLSSIFKSIFSAGGSLFSTISGGFSSLFQGLLGSGGSLFSTISGGFSSLFSGILGQGGSLSNTISGGFSSLFGGLTGEGGGASGGGLFSGLGSLFGGSGAGGGGGDFLSGLFGGAGGTESGLSSGFSSLFGGSDVLSGGFGGLLSSLTSGLTSLFSGLTSTLSGLLGGLFGGAGGGGLLGSLGGLFGGAGGASGGLSGLFSLFSGGFDLSSLLSLGAFFIHTGGTVGAAGVIKPVTTSVFHNATRYHMGGAVTSSLSSLSSSVEVDARRYHTGLMPSAPHVSEHETTAIASMVKTFSQQQGGNVVSGGSSQPVLASPWQEAPRFHDGLGPREIPAILEEGEAVIPRRSMQRLSPHGKSLISSVIKGMVFHLGGTVGEPGVARLVGARLMSTAPRFHTGLMPTTPTGPQLAQTRSTLLTAGGLVSNEQASALTNTASMTGLTTTNGDTTMRSAWQYHTGAIAVSSLSMSTPPRTDIPVAAFAPSRRWHSGGVVGGGMPTVEPMRLSRMAVASTVTPMTDARRYHAGGLVSLVGKGGAERLGGGPSFTLTDARQYHQGLFPPGASMPRLAPPIQRFHTGGTVGQGIALFPSLPKPEAPHAPESPVTYLTSSALGVTPRFHNGLMPTGLATATPSLFVEAPRYHDGVMPDHVTAALTQQTPGIDPAQLSKLGARTVNMTQIVQTPDLGGFNRAAHQLALQQRIDQEVAARRFE